MADGKYKGMSEIKNNLEKVNDILKVQGNDGNWNQDNYMCGYFNGIELAVAIMENREPKFRQIKKIELPRVEVLFPKAVISTENLIPGGRDVTRKDIIDFITENHGYEPIENKTTISDTKIEDTEKEVKKKREEVEVFKEEKDKTKV